MLPTQEGAQGSGHIDERQAAEIGSIHVDDQVEVEGCGRQLPVGPELAEGLVCSLAIQKVQVVAHQSDEVFRLTSTGLEAPDAPDRENVDVDEGVTQPGH